jgi:hypothetical protein
MSFTLRITFVGMCLFVRDGDEAMHVLLPATGGVGGDGERPPPDGEWVDPGPGVRGARHGGHAGSGTGFTHVEVETHTARLIFDTAHLRPNKVRLDGVPAHVSLRDQALELPACGAPLSTALPGDLVALDTHLRADLWEKEKSLLASRVMLRRGCWTDHDAGECWEWTDGPRRMSHVVEWTIEDYPGSVLEHRLTQLGGGTGDALPPLYPVCGLLDLSVWHVPHTDLPPDPVRRERPERGYQAHHFAAFSVLLRDPVPCLPALAGSQCGEPVHTTRLSPFFKGLEAATCMAGTVKP